jgi:hypothetical protein
VTVFDLATMASIAGPSKEALRDETAKTEYLSGPSFSLLPSEDYEATSTLQYVNSQLVAHGFARSPGLALDGLGNADSERVVKCLLSMLGQRIVRCFHRFFVLVPAEADV